MKMKDNHKCATLQAVNFNILDGSMYTHPNNQSASNGQLFCFSMNYELKIIIMNNKVLLMDLDNGHVVGLALK